MATDTRHRILRALRDMLARSGNGSVTLEAVAAEAGVSKGGLLYHFPSKSALYLGLLADVRDTVAAEMAEAVARSGAARGFLEYSEPVEDGEEGFFTSLIAAVRTGQNSENDESDAQAAQLLADIFRAWEQPMRDAVTDPVQAENIRLVGFGLYFAALTGLPPVDPAVLAALFDRLVAGQH
ncbi:DNA-binding transcriptional regulator, AcrR family [Nakamurella panacisegetis]|uniref:DNA-binding transcriptional regulator, AcrR family n=1 Tax=Nakamurella panacisegetis TaxID=1090615 RepID=A0A1H0N301_9ACTN|nr:TetR/AcrR family transcriptional regulator [Nakamurella panacisegetis]SDO86885.1 DNA-binding transcriptional regulator, AcrR family [Nakamurella panacisegetis]